ncbi:MAG: FAD-binding protein [Actinobacteria bacterium]|nr:MAG: FAD-binding protein [Actinomycetota bacterium]
MGRTLVRRDAACARGSPGQHAGSRHGRRPRGVTRVAPGSSRAQRWMREGQPCQRHSVSAEGELMASFDYDVVIIGSGFGGSVAALRAAEKGYRVGVMESGRRWPDEDIPKTQWDLRHFLARVTDVKPLPRRDPNGTAAFYAMIAWMFGGYIGSTLIGLIGSPRSTSRQRAAERMGALAGFAIVAGILSVVMLRACFGAFSGHVVALCAIAALTVFASAAATAGIQAAAGPAGTGLVILVFVILGNSASGGPFARPLLPGFWRTIGGVLPPGASVDLARSALFFDGARIAGPILVLAAWTAIGVALSLTLGGRIMDPADAEAAAAAGAAV